MARIALQDVTTANLDDLCWLCVPPARREDPAFVEGVREKRLWAERMLDRWGGFAKVAYYGGVPAGQIQYRPVPQHRVVSVDCIYVPELPHWAVDDLLEASLVASARSGLSAYASAGWRCTRRRARSGITWCLRRAHSGEDALTT